MSHVCVVGHELDTSIIQLDPDFGVEVGDTVYVSCDEGYEIRGPEELECGADGRYDELPICVEELVQCPVPVITNALVSPADPISEGKIQNVLDFFSIPNDPVHSANLHAI